MRGQQLLAAGLIGSAVVLAAGVLPAQAQTGLDGRVQGLERRMDGLESGMQEMLRMMREGQGQARGPAATAGQTPPAVSPPSMLARLNLGVCVFSRQESGPLPDRCNGLPSASGVVASPANFGFGEAFRNPQFTPFLNAGSWNPVGLLWSGLIRINSSGTHNFQINLRYDRAADASFLGGCRTQFHISDRTIVQTGGGFHSSFGTSVDATAQGSAELVAGLYPVRIFLVCVTTSTTQSMQRNLGTVSVSLDLAEPGEAAFRPLPANRLGMRQ